MRVLLLEDVERVGKAGEVVEVKDDYAKDSLFPKGLAAAATGVPNELLRNSTVPTEDRVQAAADFQARATKESEEELAVLQRTVELVDGKTVIIKAPLEQTGQLKAAVTAADIEKEIATALSTKLPAAAVRLQNPLTEPGEVKLTLEFPHGLEAEVTVVVDGF